MPQFSRRGVLGLGPGMLVGAMAGICVHRERLVLEAIAAERMPHRVVLRGVARAAFFEVRDYGASARRVAGVVHRRGIRPVLLGNGRVLFAFETLAARERAWREVNADPEWIGLGVGLKELAIFRSV